VAGVTVEVLPPSGAVQINRQVLMTNGRTRYDVGAGFAGRPARESE
jgi:hypothetical protein